jgi:uncharacterized protein with PQ loop repeat
MSELEDNSPMAKQLCAWLFYGYLIQLNYQIPFHTYHNGTGSRNPLLSLKFVLLLRFFTSYS